MLTNAVVPEQDDLLSWAVENLTVSFCAGRPGGRHMTHGDSFLTSPSSSAAVFMSAMPASKTAMPKTSLCSHWSDFIMNKRFAAITSDTLPADTLRAMLRPFHCREYTILWRADDMQWEQKLFVTEQVGPSFARRHKDLKMLFARGSWTADILPLFPAEVIGSLHPEAVPETIYQLRQENLFFAPRKKVILYHHGG